MRANRVFACVFAAAAALAGCMGGMDVEYAGDVRVSSPELVAISPGAYVVADADEPLFYSEGHYWLYRDGYWFRSDSYRGGFVRVEFSTVPQPIRAVERPQLYVHYRRHMGRDIQARGTQAPTRSRATQTQPPPHQGVPSTPPASTWQAGAPHEPGGVKPTVPQTAPPVTAPEDTQGTPMPPEPPVRPDDRAPQARPEDRPSPPGQQQQDEARGDEETVLPQDLDDQATPPRPPGDRRVDE